MADQLIIIVREGNVTVKRIFFVLQDCWNVLILEFWNMFTVVSIILVSAISISFTLAIAFFYILIGL